MNIRPLLLALAAAPSAAMAVDFNWNGNNADWSAAAEWTPAGPPGGGPGNFAFVASGIANITSNTNSIQDTFVRGTGTINQTGGTHAVTGWNFIGDQAGNNATYTIANATANSARWYAGRAGGTGTLNVGPGATVTGTDGGQGFIIGEGAGSVGVLNVTGGTLSSTAEFWAGQGVGGNGTVNHSSGTVEVGNWMAIGRDQATGAYTLSGDAILNKIGPNHIIVGSLGGQGTLTQTGGTMNVSNDIRLGEDTAGIAGNGFVDFQGGTSTSVGNIIIGWLGTGTTNRTNISGTAVVTAANVLVGDATSGTLNLNGGTLRVNTIADAAGGGVPQVNFNGTSVVALSDQAEFLPGLDTAETEVQAGGILIDTTTFSIGIGAGLDGVGGLTKTGTGTLTLSGANTYAGLTTISSGTLAVIGSVSGNINIATGATLAGNGTVGSVAVAEGATLAPGTSPGTLSVGNLGLLSSTTLAYELDTPGIVGSNVNDLISVTGNLTLDGTLQITPLAGFGNGSYRIFDYTGSLTDNGLSLQSGFLASYPGSVIDTSIANQVNLTVVPEPTAAVSALAGLGLLFGTRRRRSA